MSSVINYSLSGGTPLYTVQLKESNVVIQQQDHGADGNYAFSGVTAGTYTLFVQDSSGCTFQSTSIFVDVSPPASNPISNSNILIGAFNADRLAKNGIASSPAYEEFSGDVVGKLDSLQTELISNSTSWVDNGDDTYTFNINLSVRFTASASTTTSLIPISNPRVTILTPFSGLTKMTSSFTPTNAVDAVRVYNTNRIVCEFDEINLTTGTSVVRTINGTATVTTLGSVPTKVRILSFSNDASTFTTFVERTGSSGNINVPVRVFYDKFKTLINIPINNGFTTGSTVSNPLSINFGSIVGAVIQGAKNETNPSFHVNEIVPAGTGESTTFVAPSTTLTPPAANPDLYVTVRRLGNSADNNTNLVYSTPQQMEVFFTTDSGNPLLGSAGPAFTQNFLINLSMLALGNIETRINGTVSVGGSPSITNTSPSPTWSSSTSRSGIVFPVGFRAGKIVFDLRTSQSTPQIAEIRVTRASAPSVGALAIRTTRISAGTTYGVTLTNASQINVTQAVRDPFAGGVSGGGGGGLPFLPFEP